MVTIFKFSPAVWVHKQILLLLHSCFSILLHCEVQTDKPQQNQWAKRYKFNILTLQCSTPDAVHWRVVRRLACPCDPQSYMYAGGSLVLPVGSIKLDWSTGGGPNKTAPSPPGWGFGVRLTTLPFIKCHLGGLR